VVGGGWVGGDVVGGWGWEGGGWLRCRVGAVVGLATDASPGGS
jgi:hypothetical protein